jgi:hypothetical protein
MYIKNVQTNKTWKVTMQIKNANEKCKQKG